MELAPHPTIQKVLKARRYRDEPWSEYLDRDPGVAVSEASSVVAHLAHALAQKRCPSLGARQDLLEAVEVYAVAVIAEGRRAIPRDLPHDLPDIVRCPGCAETAQHDPDCPVLYPQLPQEAG